MTKGEAQTIRNLIERLQKRHCGCANGVEFNAAIKQMVELSDTLEKYDTTSVVSRLYLNTWIIPSLQMLLPESRNVDLAERMSR